MDKFKLSQYFSKDKINEHRVQINELTRVAEFNNLIARIDSYSILEDNWGGYGELKPAHLLIENAKNFANALNKVNILPKVMIGSSGQIAFYLKIDNLYIEIELEETKYSYICVIGLTVILTKDDLDLNEIDEDLINIIEGNKNGRI